MSFSKNPTVKYTFILVDPQVPENIGFVCRSLKNMGFNDLRIVGTKPEKTIGAHKTAYQAHDLLENIHFHDTLETAIEGMDLVVGTTAIARKNRDSLIACHLLRPFIDERESYINSVAIVFGSETNGLSHHDERMCHILSTIPMQVKYPSINLSHSVMIFAYELSQTETIKENSTEEKISFRVFDEQIQTFFRQKELEKRQPELFQRAIDAIRQVPSSQIPLLLSLLRYFKRD